jgi:hypothetical protein
LCCVCCLHFWVLPTVMDMAEDMVDGEGGRGRGGGGG